MKTKIPVSRRALLARISRRLAKDGQFIRANRTSGPRGGEPDFWIVDAPRGRMAHVKGGFDESEMESHARELGVLSDFERLGYTVTPWAT